MDVQFVPIWNAAESVLTIILAECHCIDKFIHKIYIIMKARTSLMSTLVQKIWRDKTI
jgi:hypothetical protein